MKKRTPAEDAQLILDTPADQQWWCSDDIDGGPAAAHRVAWAYLKERAKKRKPKTKRRK